ncbi:MAG: glucose-1-phosphate thymidylyltransferase-like protein [Candidatus Saganbacteria bacterium]|uniref:Glucose-1-phosphate thymidylyltransferase-like protein n=1 Tax=Candidatus Saganbacteria bacterium TaxID=2575572 RepID=A0A833P2L2_UNCSA|nr:MAG: glucose-1-phosphate thymidylyltransferase-like protein [Candidatus Saganbacteria bacterium]
MKITIVEDGGYKNLLPLVYMRPVWELVCGASTLLEKIKRQNPGSEFIFSTRDNKKTEGKTINARMLLSGKEIIYPWDLIKNLKRELEEDLKFLGTGIKGALHPSVSIYNKNNILIEEGVEVEASSVLDARQGPIYIGKGTIINPGTLLRGPLSIGSHCKIAGEITSSIIMSYTNKGHYGFIGHSYICPWVNLGAGTTNSNLKNNYSPVKVQVNGKQVDTGETFCGCFIGDHTKTAIGSMIYTGCVIGVSANLFGENYYKKFIPSFSWGAKGTYKVEDAISAARAMMARRNVQLTPQDELQLKAVFNLTKEERNLI